MSKFIRKALSNILAILILFTPVLSIAGVRGYAADFDDMNASEVFLKQQTSITCTLSSAAMMFRRTAICAGYEKWNDITEQRIRYKGWIDGVGLRWYFTSFGMTINHGYFPKEEKKAEVIELLEKYPQGYVIYNGGSQGQNHAVFLCDYDKESDIFYVADPANNAPEGRIKLEESTIVGETQDEQIENLTAYWYIADPVVEFSDGEYSADPDSIVPEKEIVEQYDPTEDVNSFDSSRTKVMEYFVVSEDSSSGTALRYYPSGNSVASDYVNKGEILFLTYKGQNKFGAWWYRTINGTYIFSSNIQPFEEYSPEIFCFKNSSSPLTGTYTVATLDETQPVALRIDPTEGNNVAAYINDGHLLYVVEEGVNSIGVKWYKTEEGYYIKASETKFVSDKKDTTAGFDGTAIIVSGKYESQPEKDIVVNSPETAFYKITASTLNVRKSPVDGEVIGYLKNGEFVKVIAVKNGWGKISYNGSDAWISLDYAVKTNAIKSVELSGVKIKNGGSIKCTVELFEDKDYSYKYSLHKVNGNSIDLHKDKIKSNTYECSVSGVGNYYFRVDVTDPAGNVSTSCSENFLVYDELKLDSLKCNTENTALSGDTIVWTANASAVSSTSVYNYSLYIDGVLVDEISSESDEYFCVPETAGEYKLEVYLSDEFSETPKIVSETVTVYKKLSIDSVDLNTTTALVGSEIVCSVSASGGTGNYSYSFSVFNNGKLVQEGSFGKENKISIQLNEEGTYKFFCAVYDSGSFIDSEFSADVFIFEQIKGDVDSDGKVTAKDARLVLRHSALLETLSEKGRACADVNSDGKVNAFDARNIMRYAAKIINSFD